MEGTKDPFGFDTQGQNYDIYRPKYPAKFVEDIKTFTEEKGTYLDLAAGTGILFFELIDSFSKDCIAHDRSAKQLSVAAEKLKTLTRPAPTSILECDAYEIKEKLPSSDLKFNLVTIAQAFHWFEPYKMLDYVTKNLLSDKGVLALTGYFCEGFDYNYLTEDESFSKSGQRHYDEFYKIVKPHFDCDRDTLDAEYTDVKLEDYFEVIERCSIQTRRELTFEEFQKYLGTYSGYNQLVEKSKGNAEFVDPHAKMFSDIRKELADYEAKTGSKTKDKPINMKMRFFLILLKKPKSK